MKKQRRYILMATMLVWLSGCGMTGPLYFPSDNKSEKAPTTNTDNVNKSHQEPIGTQ